MQRTADLKVTEFSNNGNGLAWLDRANAEPIQVEIPFTVPGDFVRAELFGKRKGIVRSKIIEILEPSPSRRKPRCAHFGECGGCRFQHISYSDQLKHKEQFVKKCFENITSSGTEFRSIMPCDEPWNYRNKMEFTFSIDDAEKKCIGLIKEGCIGKVFDINECHLVNAWVIDVVKGVKKWWEGIGKTAHRYGKGSLYSLTLREGQRTGDRIAILTVSGHAEDALSAREIENFVSAVKSCAEPQNPHAKLSIFLRIKHADVGMTTSTYDMLLYGPGYIREVLNIQVYPEEPPKALQFRIGPADFFQPNPKQTEKFFSMALRLAKIPRDAIVYDLYCGTGTLGLCISPYVKQVIGIEVSPESALNARNNAKANSCTNTTFISGAIRHILSQISENNLPRPDVIIVNPPRSGLDPEAMRHLLAWKPSKILYISCNALSQAVNVEHLQQNGYHPTFIQPVDQFSQTNQVENIVLLELRN